MRVPTRADEVIPLGSFTLPAGPFARVGAYVRAEGVRILVPTEWGWLRRPLGRPPL